MISIWITIETKTFKAQLIYLQWIFSWIAFTFSTNTISSVVTKSCRGIVRSASGFKITMEAQIFCVTLASTTKIVWSAFANTALICSMTRTLASIFDVTLDYGKLKEIIYDNIPFTQSYFSKSLDSEIT